MVTCRRNVLTYAKKLFVEDMLSVQQLNINQYVIVNRVTTEIHILVVIRLSAMKTKIVQMIRYARITCVKYHALQTTPVVKMLYALQKITNKCVELSCLKIMIVISVFDEINSNNYFFF